MTTENMPRKVLGRIPALLTAALLVLGLVVLPAPPASAAGEKATAGMPFSGKWAYNKLTTAACGPQWTQTSHPSCHENYYGNWGVDLHAAEDDPVRLNVSVASGLPLSFAWVPRANGTCGELTVVEIKVNGVSVGSLYFEHLQGAVKSGTITNGMILGYVHDWGGCNAGPHIHMEFKNTGGSSCYYDHSIPNGHTAGMSLNEGTELGMLGATGVSANKKPCPASSPQPPVNPDSDGDGLLDSSDSCPTLAGLAWMNGCPVPNLLVTRSGGVVQAKDGLGDAWITLRSDSADVRAAGNRIISVDANGTLWGKEGINGTWHALISGVDQWAVTPKLLVVRIGGSLYAKANLLDNWTAILGGSTDVRAAGNRIVSVDANGTLWAKEGVFGTWYTVISNVDQFELTPTMLVTRSGGVVQGKVGLADPWTTLISGSTEIRAVGDRIISVDTNGTLWAKEGLLGAWYVVISNVDQYALTPTVLVARTGGVVQGKVGLGDPWVTLRSDSTDIRAAGNRMVSVDSNGTLHAKEGLYGSWFTVISGVDQYLLSGF
jgi:hypothetical protein